MNVPASMPIAAGVGAALYAAAALWLVSRKVARGEDLERYRAKYRDAFRREVVAKDRAQDFRRLLDIARESPSREGRERAFEQLLSFPIPPDGRTLPDVIIDKLNRLLGPEASPEDIEDVAETALVLLWRDLPRLLLEGEAEARVAQVSRWLERVVRREASKFLGRLMAKKEVPLELGEIPTAEPGPEERWVAEIAWGELAPIGVRILELRSMGCSFNEIGGILREEALTEPTLSEAVVKQRAYRAARRLRELLSSDTGNTTSGSPERHS